MSDIEQLQQQVDEQGRVVRDLKAAKAEKPQLDEQVALLLALKKKLQIASGNGEVEADGPKKKSGGASKALVLKEPKVNMNAEPSCVQVAQHIGTKDYTPKEMALRTDIFRTITSVFEKHGAVTIDTPVFELKEIL
ncbi:Cytoplasmic and mitochondrial histidine tRNA synthetase, partial [Coemansia sp. S100]